MKTREEVQALKESWRRDPCFDLYGQVGFEEYWDELGAYQEMCERMWGQDRQKKIEEEKAEAEKLGLYGLYSLIKEIQILQKRQYNAIMYLTEGRTLDAYNALIGQR
jgi:hypothetical protein